MLDEFTHEPRIACSSMGIALRSEMPACAGGLWVVKRGHVCHMRHLRSGHAADAAERPMSGMVQNGSSRWVARSRPYCPVKLLISVVREKTKKDRL